MPTNKPTAPRATFATKPVTPLMNEFCNWIEREVGVKLDADARRAVYLGSALRTEFQKANRAGKDAKPAKPAPKQAAPQAPKTPAKPSAVKPAPKPRATRGATIATPEGVVIAEQRHIEAV